MAAGMGPQGRIAVCIHDVEPATWEGCALIRDWLCDHGVARAPGYRWMMPRSISSSNTRSTSSSTVSV